MQAPRLCTIVLATTAALLLLGCGGASSGGNAKAANDLRSLGTAFHGYCAANPKAPANEKDLAPYYENRADLSEALSSGKYVFIWNVSLHDIIQSGTPTSDTVLAYEKEVPQKGGQVLMADGSVRKMTAAEFQAAAKAKAK